MSTSSPDDDPPDGRLAAAARLSSPLVDAMFQLKEAPDAVCIDVIRNRGATQPDCVLQHIAQSGSQPGQIGARQAAGSPARTDPGAIEAFVGIDISHSGKQFLVEQGSLDGQAPAAEQGRESFLVNGERLGAWASEPGMPAEIAELEPSEPARIYKAQFAAAGEGQARVGVGRDRCLWCGDKQAPGHAQVNDPLSRNGHGLRLCCSCVRRAQFADDVLSGAVDGNDDTARKAARLPRRRIFEGLAMRSEPCVQDAVAAQARVHTAGDGLNFRQFGHIPILGENAEPVRLWGGFPERTDSIAPGRLYRLTAWGQMAQNSSPPDSSSSASRARAMPHLRK